jgi:hypothetical protein
MKLQKPKNITFIIALILVVLGVIGYFGKLPVIGTYAFWLVLIGFVLLMLGNLIDGL